jgi:hypothetical protein
MCNNREQIKSRVWDNKFGFIEGVGKDAPIITNEKGGKQSESPMALHLIDPKFLYTYFNDLASKLEYLDAYDCTQVDKEDEFLYNCYRAICEIAWFMTEETPDRPNLDWAIEYLEETDNEVEPIIRIGTVLKEGAEKYKPNNWRLIPQEEHLNHALIHIVAAIAGDGQDEHIDHAMCRLMMAQATEKSKGFEYGAYVEDEV